MVSSGFLSPRKVDLQMRSTFSRQTMNGLSEKRDPCEDALFSTPASYLLLDLIYVSRTSHPIIFALRSLRRHTNLVASYASGFVTPFKQF